MQLSGMHFHLDEHGKATGVHSAHQHQHQHQHEHQHQNQQDQHQVDVGSGQEQYHQQLINVHDHAEIDVSLPEQLGSIWSKLIPAIMACALATLIVGIPLRQPALSLLRTVTPVRRRSRWRPPLRAPPVSL